MLKSVGTMALAVGWRCLAARRSTLKKIVLLSAVMAMVGAATAGTGNLLPERLRFPEVKSFPANRTEGCSIKIPPDWGVLTLETEMGWTNVVRGSEGWRTARVPMEFRDAQNRHLNPWPNVFEGLGTAAMKPFRRDFPIPKGAASLVINFGNLGASGEACFRNAKLTLKRLRATHPCNAPLPAEALEGAGTTRTTPEVSSTERVQSLDGAWRISGAARTRICLNGLWQCRPALEGEKLDGVPGPQDNWGWGKIPSIWNQRWICPLFRPAEVLSPWFEDNASTGFEKDRAWYARTFTMPTNAAGRAVQVVFTVLNTRATVYLDGQKAGSCVYPGGAVDLTPFVKPGQDQRLVLDVTAHPLDPVTLDYNAPDRSTKTEAVVKNRGVTGDVFLDIVPAKSRISNAFVETSVKRGEITFVTEGLVAAKLVATVCDRDGRVVKTFCGAGPKFTAAWSDAALWDLHTPRNLYTVRLAAYDAAGQLLDETLPIRFGFREIEIRGRDLHLNGKKLHLRALYSPVTVSESALCCKASAVETCRRLKEEGYNLVIAGNYSHAAGEIVYQDGLLDACDEEGVLYSYTLPHIKDYNIAKLAAKDPGTVTRYRRDVKTAIDGVRNRPSVISWAMNHNCTGYCGDMNPTKIGGMYAPEEQIADEKVRAVRFRNRLTAHAAWQVVKEIDATRPCYHHESGNLDDFHTINCYLNWAPRQERSDWVEDWAKRGTKPLFFVEWGMPHISTWSSFRGPEFIWRSNVWQWLQACEGAAEQFGDVAYEDTPEVHAAFANDEAVWSEGRPFHWSRVNRTLAAISNNYHGVQSYFIADNWRCHRAWGVTASLPWDQEAFHRFVGTGTTHENPDRLKNLKRPGIVPDTCGNRRQFICDANPRAAWVRTRVGEVMHRWNQPSCAFIGGAPCFTDKTHLYTPGERVEKTLVVLNDNREPVTYTWRVVAETAAGKSVADLGKGTVTVETGGRVDVPLVCAVPSAAGEYVLKARVVSPDADQRDAFAFTVLPPPKPAATNFVRALYDPVGLTAKEFDRLGIPYTRVEQILDVPGKLVYAIVGRGALTRDFYFGQVVPCAANHRPVLVFEQTKPTLEAIGFRVQEHGLRTTWRRFADARTAGLPEAAFRDWRGESTLLPPYSEGVVEPETSYLIGTWAGFANTRVWRCRNRNAVATVIPEKPTVGDWRALADGGFDLDYAPLLERRVGWGEARIVFCQFDVTARTESDPAADALVRALAAFPRWFDGGTQAPLAFGLQAAQFLAAGETHHCWAKTPEEAYGYLVSDANTAPTNLAALVAEGRPCVCVGLDAAGVRKVCPTAPACEDVKGRFFTRIEELPPELNGLCNSRWAWHGAMDFAAFDDGRRERHQRCRPPACGDGGEAFRVVRHGKGVFVFMQVAPWMIDAEAKPYLRATKRHAQETLERILGNVGFTSGGGAVRYRDLPMPSDDPYRYYRW